MENARFGFAGDIFSSLSFLLSHFIGVNTFAMYYQCFLPQALQSIVSAQDPLHRMAELVQSFPMHAPALSSLKVFLLSFLYERVLTLPTLMLRTTLHFLPFVIFPFLLFPLILSLFFPLPQGFIFCKNGGPKFMEPGISSPMPIQQLIFKWETHSLRKRHIQYLRCP